MKPEQHRKTVRETEHVSTLEIVQVTDRGQVLLKSSDGFTETWTVPLERVPHYRRLISLALPTHRPSAA